MATPTAKVANGRKDDQQKDRWDLLPDRPVREIVKVLTYGASKYAPGNWKLVPDARDRYYAALQRHLHEWRTGSMFDPETDLHHLAHAGCCLLFLIAFDLAEFEGNKP